MGKIIDNYNLQSTLGSGVYSTVYKAINMKTKQIVAIKMVKSDKFRELPKLQQGTINEINILSNLQPCEHIIKYYDMLKTTNNFYFVYQFCNGGTLEQKLKEIGILEQSQALKYFRQMILAFRVLNKHNVMHRDLKPENILLHDGTLKIADFGFCKVLENQDEMAQTMLGSPIYMAPEILRGENYTIKADVWSLGVILFRMIFGFCPFQSCSIAKLIIRIENDDLNFPEEPRVSAQVIKLLMRMLVKDSSKRADWSEIFRFNISQNGEILSAREAPSTSFKNKSVIMTSTTVSSDSSTFNSIGCDTLTRWNTQSTKDIGLHKSKLKSKPSIKENPKQFFCNFGLPKNEAPFSMTSSHAHSTVPGHIRTTSMIRDRSCNNKIENHIKNHQKYADLIGLCIQVSQYRQQSGYALCYIITKQLQKEWIGVFQWVKKECLKDYQDMNSQEIYGIIMEELEYLRVMLQMYQQEITLWTLESLERNRKALLKEFVGSLKLDALDELVMASRVLDFIQESLLIRKETYEKLSKDQLTRQIKSRFTV